MNKIHVCNDIEVIDYDVSSSPKRSEIPVGHCMDISVKATPKTLDIFAPFIRMTLDDSCPDDGFDLVNPPLFTISNETNPLYNGVWDVWWVTLHGTDINVHLHRKR